MQIRTGHPNRPKRAQRSEKAAGKSDAADPQQSEPIDNREDSKYEEDLVHDSIPKEDPSNQAEIAAGAPEISHHAENAEVGVGAPDVREQREQGDGKHGKGTSEKSGADVSKLASKLGPHGSCKGHPCRLTKFDERKRDLGKAASLDEAGYQEVAALRDDAEMAGYIGRVIRRCDFKVGDMRGMMSIVPWFSGTTAVQSFQALEDALLGAALAGADEPWLTFKNTEGVAGDRAALSAVGYVKVAALRDGAEMSKFAKRLCKQLGVKIVDEADFDSAVQSYIASDGFKSYERLQAELRSAANAPHTSWAKWGKRPAVLASTQHALSADAAPIDRAAMRLSARGFCTRHPCRSLLAAQGRPSARGKQASLDEAGYQQVARLKDDKEMRDFILRVIAMYDCKVTSDGGLSGIVPWFSGTAEVQSFEKLEEVLLFAIVSDPKHAWINYRNTARISGDNAALNLTGYVQVAAIRSTNEMKKFARRLCKDLGVKVVNEGGFEGMVNFYSGSQNFQSYERLVSEIKSAARAPNSWAKKM